jgi:rubrerythrin
LKTEFRVFDILQIAEAIERRRAKFYVKWATLFGAGERCDLCYKLANRSLRHVKRWAEKRKRHSSETGEFGTFDPNDYVRSNPFVMAGLTWCGRSEDRSRKLTGKESKDKILKDALQRSKELMIFFEGLKEFAYDPVAWSVIDRIIGSETHYIGDVERLFEQSMLHNSVNCCRKPQNG